VNHSPELDKIAPALCAMQAELEAVQKTALNPHFKSKYADLPACWDAIRPMLAKHKLSIVQMGEVSDADSVALNTMILHESGQYISGTITMPVGRGGGPQGAGSAITYARRYMLCAATGLVSEEDDDGNTAQKGYAKKPAANTATGDNDLDDLLN
jgi:hypothetical protein